MEFAENNQLTSSMLSGQPSFAPAYMFCGLCGLCMSSIIDPQSCSNCKNSFFCGDCVLKIKEESTQCQECFQVIVLANTGPTSNQVAPEVFAEEEKKEAPEDQSRNSLKTCRFCQLVVNTTDLVDLNMTHLCHNADLKYSTIDLQLTDTFSILGTDLVKTQCKLCLNILKQPWKCSLCHSRFCQVCIANRMLKKDSCPCCFESCPVIENLSSEESKELSLIEQYQKNQGSSQDPFSVHTSNMDQKQKKKDSGKTEQTHQIFTRNPTEQVYEETLDTSVSHQQNIAFLKFYAAKNNVEPKLDINITTVTELNLLSSADGNTKPTPHFVKRPARPYLETVLEKAETIYGNLGKASIPFWIFMWLLDKAFIGANMFLLKDVTGFCKDSHKVPHCHFYMALFLLILIPSALISIMIWLYYAISDTLNTQAQRVYLFISSVIGAQYLYAVLAPQFQVNHQFSELYCHSLVINSMQKFVFGMVLGISIYVLTLPEYLIPLQFTSGFLTCVVGITNLVIGIVHCRMKKEYVYLDDQSSYCMESENQHYSSEGLSE